MNGKKEREQLCAMVDQRTNELCNLKEKNEQLQQMIRHGKKGTSSSSSTKTHAHCFVHLGDGEKLLSLLEESHHEQVRQPVSTDRLKRLLSLGTHLRPFETFRSRYE